jgi:hypothetical protein
MDGVQVVPEVPLAESLFLTKKLDRSYLSSVLKPLKDLNTTTKRINDEETRFMIDPETLELEPVLISEDETSITTSGATHKCDQWNERYSELLAYKSELGHCNVPYHWPSNPPLSQWVKRQRHQYKLKMEGKHSNLTNVREQVLVDVGFIWDSRAANWDDRFEELYQFYLEKGHCKVTKKDPKHRPLSVWLKRQRHHCRLFLAGDRLTGMTQERLCKLLEVGVKMNVLRPSARSRTSPVPLATGSD